MNTSKAIWLKHPRPILTTLHSYTYEGNESLCVMFTVGEEGDIKLIAKTEREAKARFLFLHTPNDYLEFSENGVNGKLFEVTIDIPMPIGTSIKMRKEKEVISFYSNDKLIIRLSNPAFLGSASFGVRANGAGKTYIEVF